MRPRSVRSRQIWKARAIWYLRNPDFMTRVLPGGWFLSALDGQNTNNPIRRFQALRELDLRNIIKETNVAASRSNWNPAASNST